MVITIPNHENGPAMRTSVLLRVCSMVLAALCMQPRVTAQTSEPSPTEIVAPANLAEPPLLTRPTGSPFQSAAPTLAVLQEGTDRGEFGSYTPGSGFKLAKTGSGELNFRLYTYIRYLNQKSLDATFVNSRGDTSLIDRRQDIQFNKVNIQFHGWLFDPRFRYMTYVWTSNTSQGLGAQVVVAGNLNYAFSRHITIGGGIDALPGVRTTEGNFPYWLSVDNRLIATEFFRPSYTSGIWAKGDIIDNLTYKFMLGNNLSQLGIDAGQMDDALNTIAAALIWYPTTGEYGPKGGSGDLEDHQEPATRVGAHFSHSDEDRQGQPDTEAFENVQIRLSDGSVVFAPGVFGQGILVDNVSYAMLSFDAGVKYLGFSLEGEYYRRQLSQFRTRGTGTLPFSELVDNGVALQASGMVIPQSLQVYGAWSKIFGDYGNPWEFRGGVNFYPWGNHVVRWNLEYIYLDRSPVGGLSLPYALGSTGGIVYLNVEVDF